MISLEEAIKHEEEVAEEKEKQAVWVWSKKGNSNYENYVECASEHRQLAEWLKELKKDRKAHWKSVNEGLPKKSDYYLVTIKREIPGLKPYYEVCSVKFGCFGNGKDFDVGYIGDGFRVLAWMPLPEPYKAESEE